MAQDDVADAFIVQLFDAVISPRCYAIIAIKTSAKQLDPKPTLELEWVAKKFTLCSPPLTMGVGWILHMNFRLLKTECWMNGLQEMWAYIMLVNCEKLWNYSANVCYWKRAFPFLEVYQCTKLIYFLLITDISMYKSTRFALVFLTYHTTKWTDHWNSEPTE